MEVVAVAVAAVVGSRLGVPLSPAGAGSWARTTAPCTANTCLPRHAASPATNPPRHPHRGPALTPTSRPLTAPPPRTLRRRHTPPAPFQAPNLVRHQPPPRPHRKPHHPCHLSQTLSSPRRSTRPKGTLRTLPPQGEAPRPGPIPSAGPQSPRWAAARSPRVSLRRAGCSAGESSPKRS